MQSPSDKEREDKALDALIIAAYWGLLHREDETPDLCGPEPKIEKEDEDAFLSIPRNFVSELIGGTWSSTGAPSMREVPVSELAGAMNRGNDTNELSEAARREIEQRILEADQKEAEDRRGKGT